MDASKSVIACLVCNKVRTTRGLCTSHYREFSRLVKEGQTTWARLAEEGKALITDTDLGIPRGYRFEKGRHYKSRKYGRQATSGTV